MVLLDLCFDSLSAYKLPGRKSVNIAAFRDRIHGLY